MWVLTFRRYAFQLVGVDVIRWGGELVLSGEIVVYPFDIGLSREETVEQGDIDALEIPVGQTRYHRIIY